MCVDLHLMPGWLYEIPQGILNALGPEGASWLLAQKKTTPSGTSLPLRKGVFFKHASGAYIINKVMMWALDINFSQFDC